jgi:hypothetical protein
MLTTKEAFVAGFALRCAELNIPASEVEAAAQKVLDGLTKQADVAGVLGTGLGNLAGLALLAPPALGYVGGYTAAKLRDADVDSEDLKNNELITEYRRLAAAARRVSEAKKRARPGVFA